jgi:hypothetical protein
LDTKGRTYDLCPPIGDQRESTEELLELKTVHILGNEKLSNKKFQFVEPTEILATRIESEPNIVKFCQISEEMFSSIRIFDVFPCQQLNHQ